MTEKGRHLAVKFEAVDWLVEQGYSDIRFEVPFWGLRLDVVGFKNNKPQIAIECGMVNNPLGVYQQLPIPVYRMRYNSRYPVSLRRAKKLKIKLADPPTLI